ncbi:MAG: putative hydrolase [Chloroflexi bacterium]|jgi:5-methylthioadenosine/S-adenosylhomocysteine deaminase|nr:putative hydrolase [Chloroflexota bacterium]
MVTQTADLLLTNAIVLTMDEEFHKYEPGAVAIKGDSILAVGPESDLKTEFIAQETIDCNGHVLMPGLVNAHTHVPMTLMRGLADDLRLDVWLLGYMMPVEREYVSPDFVRLGTSLACVELIRSGVTCFADMYFFEEHVAKATAEAGMRAVCSQSVLKFQTPDAQSFEESLASARDFIQRWKGHPLIEPSVAPHAPYTTTEEILQQSAALAVEFDVPLHTHLAETALEVENTRNEFGMPVIPYVKKQNLFDAKVLAAHCVHIDDGEMLTLRHHKAGVAHNPSSNLKLASGFAPVAKMLELGLNVGIGTDGPASNNDLDMFEEVRLAAFLAKSVTGDPTTLPANQAMAMATRLGARALHLGHLTGTLEPGKRADLIIVDLSALHNSPRFHRDPNGIYAQLVYTAKSVDVRDVMVNGRWLMRNHQLLTLNPEELQVHAEEYAHRIDAFLIEREKSVLSKLIAIGGASEVESFEVQAKVRIPDPEVVLAALNLPEIEILRQRHYHEFDTYFMFEDPKQGTIRYREDEYVSEKGEVTNVRYRLTLIGQAREREFPSDVLLSRSRFLAPATNSLRFYREYFKPSREIDIEKNRLRWRVLFHGTEFYINLDKVEKPDLGYFLEVKSRTWSRKDAEYKASVATALIEFLGTSVEERVIKDYLEMVAG